MSSTPKCDIISPKGTLGCNLLYSTHPPWPSLGYTLFSAVSRAALAALLRSRPCHQKSATLLPLFRRDAHHVPQRPPRATSLTHGQYICMCRRKTREINHSYIILYQQQYCCKAEKLYLACTGSNKQNQHVPWPYWHTLERVHGWYAREGRTHLQADYRKCANVVY